MKFEDYYALLQVARTATPDEIKASFRKLAMKWHPDVYRGKDKKEGEATFKKINEAYEVLSDPEKRKKYDALGADWEHGREFTPPPESTARRMTPEEFAEMFGRGGFSDFFASNFGDDMAKSAAGRAKRGERHARFRQRGADVRATLALGVGAALRGGKHSFAITGRAACVRCGGVGFVDEHVCPNCAGTGQTEQPRTVELAMPKELRDGVTLRLRGLGEAGDAGAESGDLHLTIQLEDDDTYRIRGADLEGDVSIAPWAALGGTKIDVQTPVATATLNVPSGTVAGARFRMRSMGFPDEKGGRGDFYAVVRLALPLGMTPAQRELILQAGRLDGAAKGGQS